MAKIKFTSALKRFFPELSDMVIEGNTIKEVMNNTEKKVPGLTSYILEEDGSLRKHVNIFLGEDLIDDRKTLSDKVSNKDQILIYQALSGG